MPRPFILTIFALSLVACSKPAHESRSRDKDAAVNVTVVAAHTEPWEKKIILVGTLLPNQEARVAAEVEGAIEKTSVEVGDAVQTGAELAQIDSASYQGMVNLQTANLAKA